MMFSQLKIGDIVYIIEVLGTFKKSMEYSVGTVTQVSKVYEEPLQQGQFQLPNQIRKRVIDINIASNGETKKFTVPEDRSTITDSALGLTISTNKEEIAGIIQSQYNTYKARKEAIAKCDEEMDKCKAILDKLNIDTPKEDDTIKKMQDEIDQLKQLLQSRPPIVQQPIINNPSPSVVQQPIIQTMANQ